MSKIRRGKRALSIDSDEDGAHDFPQTLLKAVGDLEWDSPTKAQRTLERPITQRRRATKQQHRQEATEEATMDPLHLGDGGGLMDHDLGNRVGTPDPDLDPDSELNAYVDAVDAHVAGFYHIGSNLFIAQGWDLQRNQTTDAWYHLEFREINGSIHTACTCPLGTQSECIHQQFFKSYTVDQLMSADDKSVSDPDLSPCILFVRRRIPGLGVQSLYSVKSTSSSALKGRAIVSHCGFSSVGGTWRCSKDQGAKSCTHINLATETMGTHGWDYAEDEEREGAMESIPVEVLARKPGCAISYMAIQPPKWASLPTDANLYSTPSPLHEIDPNTIFLLDKNSSCPCPSGRTFYNPLAQKAVRSCRLYTMYGVYTCRIELQACPCCPSKRRRYIGPDLHEKGIFNYNNSILATHELLDEYTSAYTLSETPFASWVTHVSRRYPTESPFMGEDLFRSLWFSYVSLQLFENDMLCQLCGPHPDTVIWDGITLAFGRKHLRNTLQPPTLTTNSSIVRKNIKYQPNQQLFKTAVLRKQIRLVLKGPSFEGLLDQEEEVESMPLPSPVKPMLSSSPSESTSIGNPSLNRQAKLVQDHLERIDAVYNGIKSECDELAEVFQEMFGVSAYVGRREVPSAYKNLFIQLSAEESVLQMVNFTSLKGLRSFLEAPTLGNVSLLLAIPALYKIIKSDSDIKTMFPIMVWIEERARLTLRSLFVEHIPLGLADPTPTIKGEHDWKQTGCLYSMPRIRYRPTYPGLKTDQQKDQSSQRGDRCGKYYSQYGERLLDYKYFTPVSAPLELSWCSTPL